MIIGNTNSIKCRTLMKFPILYSSINKFSMGINKFGFITMDKDQINSVKVYLREVGYQSDINAMDVYCHEFKDGWGKDSSFTWKNGADKYDPQPLSVQNICHSNLNNCDTVMYTFSEDTSNNTKKVIGYNDDYSGNGNFNWGRASRIKQSYDNNNKPRYLFVAAYFQSNANGYADIYGNK